MSIRMKILLSIVVSVLVTLGSAVVVVYLVSQKSVVEDFQNNTQVQLEILAEYTNLFLEDALGVTKVLATSPYLTQKIAESSSYLDSKQEYTPNMADLPASERILAESFLAAKSSFSAYDILYYGTSAGGFTQAPNDVLPAHFDPRTRTWFTNAQDARGTPVLSEIYRSVNGKLVVSASCAVYDATGTFIGVLGMDINLTEITKFLGMQGVGKTGHTIVCDENGLIISDPDSAERLYKNIDNVNIPDLTRLFDMRQGTVAVNIDGVDHYASVMTADNGWRLFSFIEASELRSDGMNIVRLIEYLGVAIAILLSLAGLLVAHTIVTPINRLVTAAQGVAAGNMNAVPQNARFYGELKLLYESMRSMVDQLATLIQTANTKTAEAETALEQGKQALQKAEVATQQAINARREGVEQTVNQLSGVVSDLGKVGEQLGGQASSMTSAVENQLGRTSETATAMDQVKISITDVARNAHSVAELAENAKREALSGQSMVHDVISSINKVDALAVHMNDSVAVLTQQANDIGKVMNIITDVADQTNLLALNAAIEAARAGEAGRGFAVVADEVRKLAEKTMEATRSVGSAVNAIQQGAEANRKAIAQSAQEVSNSTTLANQAGEALTRITNLVSDTNAQVHAIAGASQEQSVTTEQISNYTAEINTIATDVAESVRESSTTIISLNKLTNKLQSVIIELQS